MDFPSRFTKENVGISKIQKRAECGKVKWGTGSQDVPYTIVSLRLGGGGQPASNDPLTHRQCGRALELG